MWLELAALLVLFGAFLTGAWMLRRALPAGRLAARPVCVACGTPGDRLTSFVCPGCGIDVRVQGLAQARGSLGRRRFWAVVGFTPLLLFVAALLTGVAGSFLPHEVRFQSERSFYPSYGHEPPALYRTISLSAVGLQRQGRVEGELWADLYTQGGQTAVLQMNSPSMQTMATAPGGEVVADGEPFSREVVARWFRAAVPEGPEEQVAGHAARIYREMCEVMHLPAPPPQDDPMPIGFSSSGSSSSAGMRPARWLIPTSVIFWSSVWLLGVLLVIRIGRRDTSADRTVTVSTIAPTEGIEP